MVLPLLIACVDYGITEEPEPEAPRLALSVGELAERVCAETAVPVELRNTGNAPLEISALGSSSADWAWSAAAPLSLGPAAHLEVAVVGSGGSAELSVSSNDPHAPFSTFTLDSVANASPAALLITPYEEETLTADADATLSAIVEDADGSPELLELAWVSSLSGPIATARADAEGFVSTPWPASTRAAGPQWVSLVATDDCGATADDVVFVCADGPFSVWPLLTEGWRFDGTTTLANDVLTLTLAEPNLTSGAFALGALFEGDNIEVAFDLRIEGSGEGVALTLLDADRREGYLGGNGCGMGFGGGADCTAGPALPGWSLAIDTHDDPGDCAPGPHLSLHFDGNLATTPAACSALPEVTNGDWHTVSLRLIGGILTADVNGVRTLEQALSGFNAFSGVLGFTASNGSTGAVHQIRNVVATDFRCEL